MSPAPSSGPPAPEIIRFGRFELNLTAGDLCRDGRRVRLQPQPFKLLALLARRAGALVTRDEIRQELWSEDTFVDFDQAVNFSVRQVRDALGDSADRPIYVETVPRRGYRFIAPIESGAPSPLEDSSVQLEKALWQNVADLRLAELRRERTMRIALALASASLLLAVLAAVWLALGR